MTCKSVLLLVSLLAVFGACDSALAQVTISDGIMVVGSWDDYQFIAPVGGPGTYTLQQVPTGHPGTCRRLGAGISSPVSTGQLLGFVWVEEEYDPAAQGAAWSFDFSLEVRTDTMYSNQTVTIGVIALQGGHVYIKPLQSPLTTLGVWTTISATHLTADSLVLFGPGPPQLDLSTSGSPITFGYSVLQSQSAGPVTFIMLSLDNFSVVLDNCPCPCNGDPSHCDGVQDITDVVQTINVAFRGAAGIPDIVDGCFYETTDVNCTESTDVLDVVKMINVAFRGANRATEFCDACH